MQRHLRVSISDHNTLLETNSWGKATGWKRVDCFTLRRIVLGCTVPIFSHSGIPTALNRLWMYYPCYPLTLVPPGLLSEDAQLPAETAASSRLPSTWSRAQPQLSSAHQPEPPNSLPWGARCSVYLKVTVPHTGQENLLPFQELSFAKKWQNYVSEQWLAGGVTMQSCLHVLVHIESFASDNQTYTGRQILSWELAAWTKTDIILVHHKADVAGTNTRSEQSWGEMV